MDQSQLRTFIIDAVKHMEVTDGNYYAPSVNPGTNSGLSFGAMQNDCTTDSVELALTNMLYDTQSTTGTDDEIDEILSWANTPGVAQSDFTDTEWAGLTQALPVTGSLTVGNSGTVRY